ncbi:MAG: hypothetical protein NC253_08445 [Ruminococcus sp.]|nr:hypothetical protein [Ruminococcus sp.]
MATNDKKIVTVDLLEDIKKYIDTKDGVSIKSVDFKDSTLKFYTTEDKSGTPVATLDLPEEMFLDQTKTTLVNEFAWSATAYPNSTNPNLEGKPVFVLAVKGEKDVKYSFVSMESLFTVYSGNETKSAKVTVSNDNKITADVKISAAEGNTAVIKDDGVYVPEADLEYATKEDIDKLFGITADKSTENPEEPENPEGGDGTETGDEIEETP